MSSSSNLLENSRIFPVSGQAVQGTAGPGIRAPAGGQERFADLARGCGADPRVQAGHALRADALAEQRLCRRRNADHLTHNRRSSDAHPLTEEELAEREAALRKTLGQDEITAIMNPDTVPVEAIDDRR